MRISQQGVSQKYTADNNGRVQTKVSNFQLTLGMVPAKMVKGSHLTSIPIIDACSGRNQGLAAEIMR